MTHAVFPKALTIRQPYAGLIAHGRKTIELRSWSTDYRGEIIICAGVGKRMGHSQWPLCQPTGCTVCVVELLDVVEANEHHCLAARVPRADFDTMIRERPQWYAWQLRLVRQTRRYAVKGQQRLFKLPDAVLHKLGYTTAAVLGLNAARVEAEPPPSP